MKTKHTPGPWFVEMGDLGSYFVSSGNTFVVCQIFSNDVFDDPLPPGECQANARLIASAPLMLEACEAVQEWWDSIYPDDVFTGISGDPGTVAVVRLRKMLRAAIQKAKGTDED